MLSGFAQLCHGKAAPLRRMSANDWLIYYSPRTDLVKGKPLRAFTAIGQVADEKIYDYQMTESFIPSRRNIQYTPCKEVKITNLLDKLSFTLENRNWGYLFRYGHLEIGQEDFLIIASVMLDDTDIITGCTLHK